MLKIISETFGLTGILSNLDEHYKDQINYKIMNNFEKIVFAREMCTGKGSKQIRDELSNIIHLNNSYLICLNPYKFNYYSKFVFNFINSLM